MNCNPPRNVVWQHPTVTRLERERTNGHRALVLWLTGLSGAGKSTLAYAVEDTLHRYGYHAFVLDGDNVRHGLCADLDFSPAGRSESLRRVGEMARLFVESGIIVLAAFISPLREDRERVRRIVGAADFLEVFVSCPLEVCEQRDAKGLYRRARAGEIADFTGVSALYETPEAPALTIDTSGETSIEQCIEDIVKLLVCHLAQSMKP